MINLLEFRIKHLVEEEFFQKLFWKENLFLQGTVAFADFQMILGPPNESVLEMKHEVGPQSLIHNQFVVALAENV